MQKSQSLQGNKMKYGIDNVLENKQIFSVCKWLYSQHSFIFLLKFWWSKILPVFNDSEEAGLVITFILDSISKLNPFFFISSPTTSTSHMLSIWLFRFVLFCKWKLYFVSKLLLYFIPQAIPLWSLLSYRVLLICSLICKHTQKFNSTMLQPHLSSTNTIFHKSHRRE